MVCVCVTVCVFVCTTKIVNPDAETEDGRIILKDTCLVGQGLLEIAHVRQAVAPHAKYCL